MSLKIYLPLLLVQRLHDRLEDIKPSKNFIESLDEELLPLDYKIEKFYLLLSILSDPKGNGFKEKMFNGFVFVPLSSKHLVKLIGNNYKSYLNYLINQGFVLCKDNYYKNRCRYFHLYNSYLNYNSININSSLFNCYIKKINNNTEIPINIKLVEEIKNRKELNYVEVTLTNKSTLFPVKKKKYDLQTGRKIKFPEHIKKQMWEHFKKKMILDIDSAEKYCFDYIKKCTEEIESRFQEKEIDKDTVIKAKAILQNKYINRISSINNLKNPKKNKSWLFSRKGVNRRLNTNLTMMASDLRQFIVGYENLSYLDLTNSQPVLFNAVLQKLKKNANTRLKLEIDRYFKVTTSGEWYEELSKIYKCDRSTAKKNWMLIAYSKNNQCLRLKKKFEKKYPEIHQIIKQEKITDYRNFSIGLQKVESKIFIDEICKELVAQNILPFSIHDGVMVAKEQTEKTYNIMVNVLKKYIGGIPVIEINGVKRYPKIAG